MVVREGGEGDGQRGRGGKDEIGVEHNYVASFPGSPLMCTCFVWVKDHTITVHVRGESLRTRLALCVRG